MSDNFNRFKLLNNINEPKDLKSFDKESLELLALEIREFLIESVAQTGGHLASNLGVVELSLALHKVFETPKDKIIWDVGHQSYVHKILTGRKEKFHTLRQFGGISGFPKTNESVHDSFNTGHSSTSISAALGLARARDINREDGSVIAVIGDGALTGGLAYEALNDAGRSLTNLIVILNDNEMSISKNVGGVSAHLSKIRTGPYYYKIKADMETILSKIPVAGQGAKKALHKLKSAVKYNFLPGILFEELGFKYLGPIDGHNLDDLTEVLSNAKNLKGPVLLHVCTQKGRGYSFAEEKPHVFHGISPFEVETGELKATGGGPSFSDVFGDELCKIAKSNLKVTAITAAMPNGTGLDGFCKEFPNRFFDVGIAEQHAVTMSAGLATNGITPVIAVYSSFLQRAYDQVVHDVAIQKLHVVFCIDRAGLVGEDGETHQGVFDISYLRHIPNLTMLAPVDYQELRAMLNFAINKHDGPIVIRYPRGRGKELILETNLAPLEFGKGVILREGSDACILASGITSETALKAAEILSAEGINIKVINPRFTKPLDNNLIIECAKGFDTIFTLEDNCIAGGFGSSVLEYVSSQGLEVKIHILGYEDNFIEHGSKAKLLQKYSLDSEAIADKIRRYCIGKGKN